MIKEYQVNKDVWSRFEVLYCWRDKRSGDLRVLQEGGTQAAGRNFVAFVKRRTRLSKSQNTGTVTGGDQLMGLNKGISVTVKIKSANSTETPGI